MPLYIAHRINDSASLENVSKEFGVELDLRNYNDDLILEHDPFKAGESFKNYLQNYDHSFIILNIKSEQIEHRVLELLRVHCIKEYFFLDLSFPMIYRLSEQGEKKIAIRYSEFEPIELALANRSRADWVWIDCFTHLPVNNKAYEQLKAVGYKLCLVSPELQGQPEKIEIYAKQLNKEGVHFDAICTKQHNIEKWRQLLDWWA